MKSRIGKVLVVGAGISGLRSSLDLAEVGYKVSLIDRAPFLGGILSQLDHQFPTDHCGMCKMLPLTNRDLSSQYCLRKGFYHENIDIRLSTELISIAGEPGQYKAVVQQQASGIDPDLCIGCGECLDKCPVVLPDAFNLGLESRKAIYHPVPHNFPHLYQIDFDACTRCGDCVPACPTQAISLPQGDQVTQQLELEVGAVILSGGTDYFKPDPQKDPYGYHLHPDVVTSREFERLISGTGPGNGQLVRLSNGQPVKDIAWFQCVGSRDLEGNADFCSSVCCMHAIKEARLLEERFHPVSKTIFYMDLRTFGKSFQHYREEAQDDYRVNFERARIHSVTGNARNGRLNVRYLPLGGSVEEKEFDMIVLAVGQRPSPQTKELAEAAGVQLNQWGFTQSQPFSAVMTGNQGVILSGSYSGLKDISESLIQAGSAALNASKILHEAGGALAPAEETDTKPDLEPDQPLKVLVALCHTKGLFSTPLSRELLEIRLKLDPVVNSLVVLEDIDIQQTESALAEILKQHPTNMLLLLTGLPDTFRKRSLSLSEKLGLDASQIKLAGLFQNKLQDSSADQVHDYLTRLIKSELAAIKHISHSRVQDIHVNQRSLVVGGGIAGITAALAIANNGFEVDLVEQNDHLGGNLEWISHTLEGQETAQYLEQKVGELNNHPLIQVHTNTEIKDCIGSVGNFTTSLLKSGKAEPGILNHGTVILATGSIEAQTSSYCYAESDKIVTQRELETGLDSGQIASDQLKAVAMIQCVDSRDQTKPYCSRVCCSASLKNALRLKKENPGLAIYIIYRDMMSYGFSESYYTEARRQGVIFIPYRLENLPEVSLAEGKAVISMLEPILDRPLQISADLLVLATGLVPVIPENLRSGLGFATDPYGFFQEAEPKWRPLDSLKEGIFACGTCLSPRNITESIATGEAAAQRALRILCDNNLFAAKLVAEVRQSLCSSCEQCIDACPYGARSRDSETDLIAVNSVACQGCGTCAVTCPNGASILNGFTGQQMFEMINTAVTNEY